MIPMNNKIFSNKQERMVSDFLGWKQVTGSGARPFYVGDVVSDDWLGECKTHATIKSRITFKCSVWSKIRIEAKSCNKFAVYFSDDGSQKAKRTYCVISSDANPFNFQCKPKDVLGTTKSGNLSLSVDNLLSDIIYSSSLNDESVYIMSLPMFKSLLVDL